MFMAARSNARAPLPLPCRDPCVVPGRGRESQSEIRRISRRARRAAPEASRGVAVRRRWFTSIGSNRSSALAGETRVGSGPRRGFSRSRSRARLRSPSNAPETRRLSRRGYLRAPLSRGAEQRHPAESAALRRHRHRAIGRGNRGSRWLVDDEPRDAMRRGANRREVPPPSPSHANTRVRRARVRGRRGAKNGGARLHHGRRVRGHRRRARRPAERGCEPSLVAVRATRGSMGASRARGSPPVRRSVTRVRAPPRAQREKANGPKHFFRYFSCVTRHARARGDRSENLRHLRCDHTYS